MICVETTKSLKSLLPKDICYRDFLVDKEIAHYLRLRSIVRCFFSLCGTVRNLLYNDIKAAFYFENFSFFILLSSIFNRFLISSVSKSLIVKLQSLPYAFPDNVT